MNWFYAIVAVNIMVTFMVSLIGIPYCIYTDISPAALRAAKSASI